MKPILLKISAFGSYAEEVNIDFTKVHQGIFLVTGDTGAGKTTIFDAMTFALYDQTSGGKRETSDMRSQYANPETPTYVDFTFCVRKEIYRIRRNPRYLRASKRRDKDGNPKLTTEMPSVELYFSDGTLFPGKLKETNEKIVEIMGIDAGQFLQIAMIAQGDFLKLLHASSNTRKEIFAKLFHTDLYERIAQKLRGRAKSLDKSLFENETLCEHELSYIQPMQEGNYEEEWSVLRQNWDGHRSDCYLPMEEISGLIKRILEEMGHSDRQAKREAECLEETVELERRVSEQQKQEQDNQTRIDALTTFLTEHEGELVRLEQEKQRAEEQYEVEQETLLPEIARLQDALPRFKRLGELNQKKKQLQQTFETLKDMIAAKGDDFTPMENNEELVKQDAFLQGEYQKLMEKQKVLKNYVHQLGELRKVSASVVTMQKKTISCLHAYEEKSVEYDRLNAVFIKEQVGIIAMTLEENKPCPVCGSCTHPLPAVLSGEAVTEIQVKSAREERNRAEAVLHEQRVRLQEQQLQEKSLAVGLEQEGERLFGSFRLEEAEQLCEQKKIEWKDKELLLADCRKLLQCAQQKATVNGEIEILRGQLPGEDEEYARKKLSELQNRREELAGIMRKASTAFGQLEQEMQQKKGALKTARELAAELTEKMEVLNEQFILLKMQNKLAGIELREADSYQILYEAARDRHQKLHMILQRNREAAKQIDNLFTKRRELIMEYEVISKLDRTANGNVTGSVKMDFQTYIQRYYFKKIIQEANKRLFKMSHHQFILKCKEFEDIKSQGAAGLDLDVYSLVTDTTRDVKTLSGGESFMAALSMALGMSDVIMAAVGRIHIDTMFVDEGFGSLDEESRAQAISILQELAGDSRLIGIISHVTELKEQIDRKLVVSKTDKGSTVKWLLDS